MKRIVQLAILVATASATGSCSDRSPAGPEEQRTPGPGVLPAGMVVSNPLSGGGASSLDLLAAAAVGSVAYVSAASGTFPAIASIAIRNVTAGGPDVTVGLVNGGFDPVAITARVDDELSFIAGGSTIATVKVPRRQAPRVVRTNPAKGRTDVALNIQIAIVFSEPVEAATVAAAITLRAGGELVPGRVSVSADGLSAEFTPDEPLAAMTEYALEVEPSIRDLDGDTLETGWTAGFATVAGSDITGMALAFVRTGLIHTAFADGSNAVALPLGYAADPVWSPEGRHLAFRRSSGSELCVAEPDGSGVRCRQVFLDNKPSWSPDGSELAFVGSTEPDIPSSPIPRQLYALRISDMSLRVILGDVGIFCGTSVSWSPDGERIAFTSLPSMCGILATVRPDGSDLQFLSSPAGLLIRAIAWAPDGRTFAAVINPLPELCPNSCEEAVGVLNADGTGWRPLVTASWTHDSEMLWSPTWVPDGSGVLFSYGWNCFMGCTDNRTLFVRRDGSGKSTILLNAADASIRRQPQG